jgi:hypothetical protein
MICSTCQGKINNLKIKILNCCIEGNFDFGETYLDSIIKNTFNIVSENWCDICSNDICKKIDCTYIKCSHSRYCEIHEKEGALNRCNYPNCVCQSKDGINCWILKK